MSHRLFCYGTLQVPEVMESVVGRRPAGKPARLPGYSVFRMREAEYPGIVPDPEGEASGLAYEDIADVELAVLDRFEGPQYRRREVRLAEADGRTATAWVYAIRESRRDEATDEPWRLEDFLANGLSAFMDRFVRGRRREYRED